MKRTVRKITAALLSAIFILSLLNFVSGAAAENCRFYILPEDNEGLSFSVGSYDKSGSETYLFLPNTLNAERVVVRYGGSYSSVTGASLIEWNKSSKYFIVDASDETAINVGSRKLIFMQSVLPAVSIVINDGESIDTINSDKNAKIGAKVMIDGAENPKYNLALTDIQMKTRGNTTFWPDKKPYQIKFDKKTDLFGMGKAKKWILNANYYDGTSIKTKLFFDLAEEIGMEETSKSVFVDLYIDGDYRGVYQLMEKVEIGSARVDLSDDYGVIVEMEASSRIGEETDPYFITSLTKKPFVYKDYNTDFEDLTAENLTKIAEVRSFVEGYINEFERELYATDQDWDKISSMIDVDSFILYYYLNEYGEQVDCTLASTYFFIDGPDDVLHCGPVWDFDRVCGFNDPVPKNTDYLKNITDNVDNQRVEWFKELFRSPEFVKRANELYSEKIEAAFDTAKVNAAIDSYQEMLMPSLRMNHVKWVVFHNRNYIAEELVPDGTTEDRIAYTTDSMKSILSAKKVYMDTVYGEYFPAISYTTYSASGAKQKDFTGGCMSYSASVAGLSVELFDSIFDGGISYKLYADDRICETVSDGEIAKSTDGFVRPNGISVSLTGNVANYFAVQYRVSLGSNKWSPWVTDGKLAGRSSSSNGSYLVDRIQMRIVKKSDVVFSGVRYVVEGADDVVKTVPVGNVIKTDYVPEISGYEFTGWFTDEDRTEIYAEDAAASGEELILYAGTVSKFRQGDVNGDGRVNTRDLSLLKRIAASAAEEDGEISLERADVNGDGKVNTRDISILKRIIAGEYE
ncbi:MAG: CotH kinase family protein [Clostridia bacterium]|nr:CotH kinase family protein [Clostridia bacterium]